MSQQTTQEESRKAFRKDATYNAHHQAVTKWLQANPQIGFLNGGKYYKIVDGKTVNVAEFGQ
tara:strand:- start:6065 stop:6250 length:186 start_codon:yes stop_codon:yes gene_type:complete